MGDVMSEFKFFMLCAAIFTASSMAEGLALAFGVAYFLVALVFMRAE